MYEENQDGQFQPQGDAQTGYQQGNPQTGYQQGNPQTGYQQGGSQTGYQQGNPQMGYAQSDPRPQMSYQYDNQPQGMQPAPYPPEQKKSNGFGIASLVCGILAVLSCCVWCVTLPLAVLSIVFGILQLTRKGSKPMAVAGIICSGVALVLMIVFLIWAGYIAQDENYQSLYNQIYNEVYDDLNEGTYY